MVGLEQTFKFQIGLVVKRNRFKILEFKTCFSKHIARGMAGKITILLFTGKTLLMRSRNDTTVHQNRGGAVSLCGESRNPERVAA